MVGSWGTDNLGNMIDQSSFSTSLDRTMWALPNKNKRSNVVVKYDNNLWDGDKIIGQGWNAFSTFYDGDKAVGWVTCDNFIYGKPLLDWEKAILAELGHITGQLITKVRKEAKLQDMIDLKKKELKESQRTLLEVEKLASLGSMVSGVSHELNTPIGIALTSTSYINNQIFNIKNKINENILKKRDLAKALSSIIDSTEVAESSLQKSLFLISNFKELTTEDSHNMVSNFNLYALVASLSGRYKKKYKEISLTISNNIQDDIVIHSDMTLFIQIFNKLIENSVIHGFDNRTEGHIKISSIVNENRVIVVYENDGIRIPDENRKKLFDPFYTTKRHIGATGIGLSFVHNTLHKIGGSIEHIKTEKGVKFEIRITTDSPVELLEEDSL